MAHETPKVELAGELLAPEGGEEAVERGDPGVGGRVLAAEGCEVGAGVRLDGPLVLGQGCGIGAGARVKESVVLPGAKVPQDALVAGGVYGRKAA